MECPQQADEQGVVSWTWPWADEKALQGFKKGSETQVQKL